VSKIEFDFAVYLAVFVAAVVYGLYKLNVRWEVHRRTNIAREMEDRRDD
jgi:hypothetical protein